MKLKEAKKLGYAWIAVDRTREIWGYVIEPTKRDGAWWPEGHLEAEYIGMYSGSKSWEDTLRECT